MKKFALRLVLSLVLCSSLVSIPEIRIAKAESTIYIREDGSVGGTDKIQRDGNVYTFTDNIFNQTISVQKDRVRIDGAGYTLQGTGSGRRGIELPHRNNVTIRNIQIRYFSTGIRIIGGSNNVIYANNITNNGNADYGNGVEFWFASSHNILSGNNITNNWVGIQLYLSCRDNIISENYITANKVIGIWLYTCSNNSIIRNNITNNNRGVQISGSQNAIIVYNNNFINNTVYIDLDGYVIGTWDNGKEGNYWTDYDGTDNDGDGIGDTPYLIDMNNQDNYPLMEPFIIPEFPSWITLTLFIVTTLVVLAFRNRFSEKRLE